MPTILLAGSMPQRLERLEKGLAQHACEIRTAKSNAEAWASISNDAPDAVVIDVTSHIANLDPWLLCTELALVLPRPFIVLIRPGRNGDRLRALRAGACQCLTVPVSPDELYASLQAALGLGHKVAPSSAGGAVESYADSCLCIDLANRQVRREHETYNLTGKEYRLLARLMRERGNVVATSSLTQAVWVNGKRQSKSNRLKTYISRLRHKIEPDPGHPRYIVSQHGFGYGFIPHEPALN